jgi:predicted DNA-binding protein
MKKKMGRPRLSKKGVAVVFSVRLPPEEARLVRAAVSASGHTKADWLRNALLAAARKQ